MLHNAVGLLRQAVVRTAPLAAAAVRHLNANRAVVTKIKRTKFARLYPTTAVLPNGATITGDTANPIFLTMVFDFPPLFFITNVADPAPRFGRLRL